jgi:hypothetical protein
MPKYNVMIREVHVSHRTVEAEDEKEAIEQAGGGTETYLEYSHTLDPDTWTVEKIEEENGPSTQGTT